MVIVMRLGFDCWMLTRSDFVNLRHLHSATDLQRVK